MNNLWSILTRNLRRDDLAKQFRAITNAPLTPEVLDLLTDPDYGDVTLEMLKMGVHTDDLADAIYATRVVAGRTHCSPMYAAQFVANVRIFTDAPLAPAMLSQWLKPEEDR